MRCSDFIQDKIFLTLLLKAFENEHEKASEIVVCAVLHRQTRFKVKLCLVGENLDIIR